MGWRDHCLNRIRWWVGDCYPPVGLFLEWVLPDVFPLVVFVGVLLYNRCIDGTGLIVCLIE